LKGANLARERAPQAHQSITAENAEKAQRTRSAHTASLRSPRLLRDLCGKMGCLRRALAAGFRFRVPAFAGEKGIGVAAPRRTVEDVVIPSDLDFQVGAV
jgi:hypothetical protein